jgi:hypothetical protein
VKTDPVQRKDGRHVKVSLLVQTPGEDSVSFGARVNEELARLGGAVKDVKMAAAIHEDQITGKVSLPRILSSVLIMYEDSAS